MSLGQVDFCVEFHQLVVTEVWILSGRIRLRMSMVLSKEGGGGGGGQRAPVHLSWPASSPPFFPPTAHFQLQHSYLVSIETGLPETPLHLWMRVMVTFHL